MIMVWMAAMSGKTANCVSPTNPRVKEPRAASFNPHPSLLATIHPVLIDMHITLCSSLAKD